MEACLGGKLFFKKDQWLCVDIDSKKCWTFTDHYSVMDGGCIDSELFNMDIYNSSSLKEETRQTKAFLTTFKLFLES